MLKKWLLFVLLFLPLYHAASEKLKIALWDIRESNADEKTVNQASDKINADLFYIISGNNDDYGIKELKYKHVLFNDPGNSVKYTLFSNIETDSVSNKAMIVPYKNDKNYHFSQDTIVTKFSAGNNKKIYIIFYGSDYSDNNPVEYGKKTAEVKALLDIIAGIYAGDKNPYIILTGNFNTERSSEILNIIQKSGLIILNYKYDIKKLSTMVSDQKEKEPLYFIINKPLMSVSSIKSLKSIKIRGLKTFPVCLELEIK